MLVSFRSLVSFKSSIGISVLSLKTLLIKGKTKSAFSLSTLTGISFCEADFFGSWSFIIFSMNSFSIFSKENYLARLRCIFVSSVTISCSSKSVFFELLDNSLRVNNGHIVFQNNLLSVTEFKFICQCILFFSDITYCHKNCVDWHRRSYFPQFLPLETLFRSSDLTIIALLRSLFIMSFWLGPIYNMNFN